jgi:ribosomal protein S1
MSDEIQEMQDMQDTPTPVVVATPSSIDDLTVAMALQGRVKRIELYGAFVDIGIGLDGLLHISQLGQPNVRNVEDVVKVGETITVYVLKIDRDARRIALSLERPAAVSWDTLHEGDIVKGKVIRIENFGVFVEFGAERAGMIHVSELAAGYVNAPEDVVKLNDEVTAQIIKLNRKKKRIDLSIKKLEEKENARAVAEVEAEQQAEPSMTAMEMALRRAMGTPGAPPVVDPYENDRGSGTRRPDKGNRRRDNNRRHHDHDDMEDIFERTLRSHKR